MNMAYCGLLCQECPLYMATMNHDSAAKEKLAIECSTETIKFTADDMTCEGCFSVLNDKSRMCGDCEIRNCAKVKAVLHCGACASYPCEVVDRRIPNDSANRARLNTWK